MQTLQSFLLVLHIIVAFIVIVVAIFQRSERDSLAGIGGSNMSASNPVKSSDSFLNKFTGFLIAIFMINSLALAKISFEIDSVDAKLGVDSVIEKLQPSVPSRPQLPNLD